MLLQEPPKKFKLQSALIKNAYSELFVSGTPNLTSNFIPQEKEKHEPKSLKEIMMKMGVLEEIKSI